MRGARPVRQLAALALLLAPASCTKPRTEIVFRVLSDDLVPAWCDLPGRRGTPECPAGARALQHVDVRVCRGACAEPPAGTTCARAAGELLCGRYLGDGAAAPSGPRDRLPGDLTVVPEDPSAGGRVELRVSAAVAGATGTIERRFVAAFVPEQTVLVEVWLSSRCLGDRACAPAGTCGRDGCEPVENPPSRPFTPLPPPGPVDAGRRADAPDAPPDVADAGADAVDAADDGTDAADGATDAADVEMDAADDGMDAADVETDAADVGMDAADVGMDATDVGTDATDIGADAADVRDAADAGDGAVRCSETLPCPGALLCCGVACVDTTRDAANCGMCGLRCAGGAACLAGRCTAIGEIVAGRSHACLVNQSTAWCWGRNDRGQLGRTGPTTVPTPEQVTVPGAVLQVSAGAAHTCVRVGSGGDARFWCWGDNASRQAANSDAGVAAPTMVPLTEAIDVAAGGAFTCARAEQRGSPEVWCWGANAQGQSGQADGGAVVATPAPVTVMGLPGPAQVVAGDAFACALFGGRPHCWGANNLGQLGRGAGAPASDPTPRPVADLTNVVALIAGANHACAIKTDGVYCWGANGQGQATGIPGAADAGVLRPVLVGGGAAAPAVPPPGVGDGAGDDHTCAITAAGTVGCWGGNAQGQLGRPAADAGAPALVGSLGPGVTRVAAGRDFTCALVDGAVWCWGRNSEGQLGTGASGGSRPTPTRVAFPPR